MSTSLLLLGVLFGSLGGGYCLYGRKQSAPIPFLCGLLLTLVPYFIPNGLALLAIGVLLAALPFLIRS